MTLARGSGRVYDLDAEPVETTRLPRRSSGVAPLWRRVPALGIDALFLLGIGVVIGGLCSAPLAALGPWGRLIGAGIAAVYFGFPATRVGGGQTPGKRLLGIRVVGRDGQPVSAMRALIRASVPLLVLGWVGPPAAGPVSAVTPALLLLAGAGGALAYLYAVPRQHRGLHDLAAGTWVVRAGPLGSAALRSPGRAHLVVAALWCAAMMVAAFLASRSLRSDDAQRQRGLRHALERTLPVREVAVTDRLVPDASRKGRRTRRIQISAVLQVAPESYDAVAAEIARLALAQAGSVRPWDVIEVRIAYGYDILIARAFERREYSYPADDWRRRVSGRG